MAGQTAQLQFFNPYAAIRETANCLPHWQQCGAVYFVTFRLADAIPAHLLGEWSQERDIWIKLHPEPWTTAGEQEYHRRFSGAIERWLDRGYGTCILREPECATIVDRALHHFDGVRIGLISSVVMPNHVHLLFVQNPEFSLEKLLQSWKRFTTREINKLKAQSGIFWQRDYFDRLVRDQDHFANCVRYIRRNPEKARLTREQYVLYESDLARDIA